MDAVMESSDAESESAPPGFQCLCPPPPLPEMGQVVCGTCRELNSYPRGARRVRCSCCQTINVVLEAHQTGNVKCGGCTVLLMYPYGAPLVKCSVCHFVTEIGVQNERPPLSVQQGQPPPIDNPTH
ncbi:protein LOL2-like protein [Cinnamomum micranthum f. kanehirae]|uniref:Protein LOL2-like protein n=1 Tax=Cinnamomum micranthum f. kanehirae TaxID=337451 RepID=A0A443PFN7_9MAGN|nr:protein LOL2-like protein [Cinnamomum micranthum f. kanehirae]